MLEFLNKINPFYKDPVQKEYDRYMDDIHPGFGDVGHKDFGMGGFTIALIALVGLASGWGVLLLFALLQNWLILPIYILAIVLITKYDEIILFWKQDNDLGGSVNTFSLLFLLEIIMIIVYLVMIL